MEVEVVELHKNVHQHLYQQTPINWQSIHAPRKKRVESDHHQNGKVIPNTRGLTSTSFSRVSL